MRRGSEWTFPGKALAYAHRWAFGRNPEYLAFDRLGGDCTSFVSQCLLAGGASGGPDAAVGLVLPPGNDKAPAWSGVEPFWRFFTRSDREDGLRGVECGPEDLQPGDVIQLSFDGRRYAHCLLVVGTGRQISSAPTMRTAISAHYPPMNGRRPASFTGCCRSAVPPSASGE